MRSHPPIGPSAHPCEEARRGRDGSRGTICSQGRAGKWQVRWGPGGPRVDSRGREESLHNVHKHRCRLPPRHGHKAVVGVTRSTFLWGLPRQTPSTALSFASLMQPHLSTRWGKRLISEQRSDAINGYNLVITGHLGQEHWPGPRHQPSVTGRAPSLDAATVGAQHRYE